MAEELPLDFLPSAEEAETMSFEERIGRGIEMALSDGLDVVFWSTQCPPHGHWSEDGEPG